MAHPSAAPNFDIGGLIRKSWQIVQQNGAVLIGGSIVIMLAEVVTNVVLGSLGLPGVAHLVIGGPLALGYYAIALRSVRGEAPQFPQLFDGFNRFVPAFLANLFLMIAGIGWALCIVPGFLAYTVLCLMFFFMHDRKMDAIPAMQASYETVIKGLGPWALLYLVFIALNIAGALCCGVGLFITIPIGVVMLALAYEQVAGGYSASAGPGPGPDIEP